MMANDNQTPVALEVAVENVSSSITRPSEDSYRVACCLRVPNRLLWRWHSDSERPTDTSFVQLLNDAVRGHTVALDTHCERLERHLQRRAGEVSSKARRLAFRQRQRYLDGSVLLDVYYGETLDATSLVEEVEEMDEMLSEDIAVWVEGLQGAQETISQLKEELKAARTSVQSTSQQSPANIGLPMHQVSSRQRRRKVLSLKESSHKALWFVETFGLSVESVSLRDSTTGDPLVLSYSSHPPSPADSTSDGTLHQTLYLLERFGVSDEFYHELSMTHPSLPRSSTYMHTSLVH